MNDIIKIVKPLEKAGLLLGGAAETVKHQIKTQESGLVGAMMGLKAASLIAPVAS